MSISLDNVKQRIDYWRNTRDKPGSIPKDIWNDIIELANVLPKGEICKQLKISGQQLNSKLDAVSSGNSSSFVEISNDSDIDKVTTQNTNALQPPETYKDHFLNKNKDESEDKQFVSFTRTDGATIKLYLSQKILLTVLNDFLGGTHASNNT